MALMILGILLVAASVWFVMRAGTMPRLRMESHLAQIDGYGVETVSGEVEGDGLMTPSNRPVDRLAAALGRMSAQSLRSLPRLQPSELHAAGIYTKEPDVVEGYRLLIAGIAVTLVALYAVVLTGRFSPLAAVLAIAAAFIGWDGPAFAIRRRGRDRLAHIDRQLPDLIDLLVAAVEAGMSVGASMSMLGGRFDGPLGEELRLLIRQQQLGISGGAALAAFADRAATPSVRAFTRTLVRAEAMGGSIGAVLRNLAIDARRRRSQAARERAAKVPLKLLFPLILLIFPALFVVLLYPAGYTIIQQFGN